jgi:hypothetical protein
LSYEEAGDLGHAKGSLKSAFWRYSRARIVGVSL